MRADEEKWKRLKPKYKAISFCVMVIGLLLSFAIVGVLAWFISDIWSVSLSAPNCKDDRDCAALSWITLITFPFALVIGLLASSAFVGKVLTGKGVKASFRMFMSSKFPESWYGP